MNCGVSIIRSEGRGVVRALSQCLSQWKRAHCGPNPQHPFITLSLLLNVEVTLQMERVYEWLLHPTRMFGGFASCLYINSTSRYAVAKLTYRHCYMNGGREGCVGWSWMNRHGWAAPLRSTLLASTMAGHADLFQTSGSSRTTPLLCHLLFSLRLDPRRKR